MYPKKFEDYQISLQKTQYLQIFPKIPNIQDRRLIMKNKIIILIIILIIFGGLIIFFSSKPKPNVEITDVEEFDLTNYQWEIEQFSLDKKVGLINDIDTDIERAKELWIETFNLINGNPFNPINGLPNEVFFDKKSDCWYIHGTLPENVDGGVPHALIQRDGTVLAVWHDL